jgi:hypothetical protein
MCWDLATDMQSGLLLERCDDIDERIDAFPLKSPAAVYPVLAEQSD